MTWLIELLRNEFFGFLFLTYIEVVSSLLLIQKFSMQKPKHYIRNTLILWFIVFAAYSITYSVNSIILYLILQVSYTLYIRFTYDETWKISVLLGMLMQIVVILISLAVLIMVQYIFGSIEDEFYFGLFVNSMTLCIVLIVFFNNKFDLVIDFVYKKLFPLKVTIILCYFSQLTFLTSWKLNKETILGNYIFISITIVILITIMIETLRSHFDKAANERELFAYKNYLPVIEEVVSELKRKQHEYDKHIQAFIGMPLVYDDYESLSEAMKSYLYSLERDDTLIELLKISKMTIAGFLHYKLGAGKEDIINARISINRFEIQTKAKDPEIIEIVGTLIDNAFEAVSEAYNDVQIIIDSMDGHMIIQVLNEHPYIDEDTLKHICKKGFSTKNNPLNRGFGLYTINLLVKKYKGILQITNKNLNNKNYISVEVVI